MLAARQTAAQYKHTGFNQTWCRSVANLGGEDAQQPGHINQGHIHKSGCDLSLLLASGVM